VSSPPPHKPKAPPQKRKVALLKTFWPRFFPWHYCMCLNRQIRETVTINKATGSVSNTGFPEPETRVFGYFLLPETRVFLTTKPGYF